MIPPGAREIHDPAGEAERLAALRKPPAAAPDPGMWTVETVQRVRVTHHATGKRAEAPTQGEAMGKLLVELLRSGDITVNDARRVHGLPPFEGADFG